MVNLSTDTWVNWDPERGAHYTPQSTVAGNPEEETHTNGLKRLRKNHCTLPSHHWHFFDITHSILRETIPDPLPLSTLLSPTTVPCNPPSPCYPQWIKPFSVPSFSLSSLKWGWCHFYWWSKHLWGADIFIEPRLKTKALSTTSSTKMYLNFLFKHALLL